MSSDGPSKTKKEKKETNTINPKTVIAIKIYVRSMFLIFHSTVTDLNKTVIIIKHFSKNLMFSCLFDYYP